MTFKLTKYNKGNIAHLTDDFVIKEVEDAVDLLGNAHFEGANAVIIKESNLTPDFFKLSTKIAGEILQKFSNYRMRLAII